MSARFPAPSVLASLVALVAVAPCAGYAVAGPVPAAYELAVTVEPAAHGLQGRATMRFATDAAGADTLVFHLHGELRVDSLAIGGEVVPSRGRPVFYSHDYALIARRVEVVTAGRDLAGGLTVWYSGPFHASRVRAPSDYMRIDADGALLRAYGYSLWFPVFLDAGDDSHVADFGRVAITVPAGFAAVFAGELTGTERAGDLTTWRWRADGLDVFAAQLTARRFVAVREEGCTAWSLDDPAARAAADRIIDFARRLDAVFRDRYRAGAAAGGLHVMQMPRYGDIASANVIGIAADGWLEFDPAGHHGRTVAHELVHAPVRVRVRRADPLFALAVEGFPSYFHLPALGELLGEEHYREYVRKVDARYRERRATGADARGRPLPPEKPILAITPEEIGLYKDRFVLADRVVLFFDAIRRRLGTTAFTALTRDLFDRETLDRAGFEAVVLAHLPDFGPELQAWLATTRYPVGEPGD